MSRILTALALAFLAVSLSTSRASAAEEFLGSAYPIGVEISYTAGLFQWIDSLAGTTVGKTVAAHREDYIRRWGKPDAAHSQLLARFSKARLAHAVATQDRSAMLGIFCEASSLEAAITEASKSLTTDDAANLAAALFGLAPKFDQIWDKGAVPRAFVKRVAKDKRRGDLAAFLAQIAGFYGVDPATMPRPRLVLVAVPEGWGTHAQAVGRSLLLEINRGDDRAAQAAVIVHENCHFLFDAVPPQRRAQLEESARSFGESGEAVWTLLGEALPTVLGQGIADQTFGRDWSRNGTWYHRADVDAYAKSLHGAANHAVATGLKFDESFVRLAIQIWVRQQRHEGPEIQGMDRPRVSKPSPTPR